MWINRRIFPFSSCWLCGGPESRVCGGSGPRLVFCFSLVLSWSSKSRSVSPFSDNFARILSGFGDESGDGRGGKGMGRRQEWSGLCRYTSPFSDNFARIPSDFGDGDGDGAGWNWRESVVVSSPFSDGFAWILSLKFSFQVQRPEMARAHGSPTRWCLRQTTMMRYAGCRILWDAGRRAGADRE